MSHSPHTQESEEKLVPIGVVFITVGILILLVVVGIWVVAPRTMPQSLYALVEPYLEETAVSLPTPAAIAALPATTAPQPSDDLLAITPAQPPVNTTSSTNETTKQDPTIGLPIRIVIPAIQLDAPVSQIGIEPVIANGQTYYQWLVPNEFKAGWHDNSARLGQLGNTVLNGHHNVYGEVFRDLEELEQGDKIILYDRDHAFTYEITDIEILAERDQPLEVRLQNAQWIAPTEDERITLVTCWPYTDNTHRLIVVAHPTTKSNS